MKTCLLIQPGAFGDILICAPIAKEYASKGYEVSWPAREKFHKLLNKLDYVTPLLLDEEVLDSDWLRSDVIKCNKLVNKYDLVLNLADRGPHPTAQMASEKFEQTKYRISNVPFELKHNLKWKRNLTKELELYERYVKNVVGENDYAFVHNTSSHEEKVTVPNTTLPIIMCEDPVGYDIFDWYLVAINAKEIYVTESLVWAFLDGIVWDLSAKSKYLLSRRGLSNKESYSVSNNWDRKYLL